MSSADHSDKKSRIGLKSGIGIGSIITILLTITITIIGYNSGVFYMLDDEFAYCPHGCEVTIKNDQKCPTDTIQVDKTIIRTYCEYVGDYTGKYSSGVIAGGIQH